MLAHLNAPQAGRVVWDTLFNEGLLLNVMNEISAQMMAAITFYNSI